MELVAINISFSVPKEDGLELFEPENHWWGTCWHFLFSTI
jgi:hypothetical protein